MTCDRLLPVAVLLFSLGGISLVGCSQTDRPPVVDHRPPEAAPGGVVAPPLAQAGRLRADQVAIGGVGRTMTEADIRAQMGAPTAVTEEEWGCCGPVRQLTYPTLSVGLLVGDDTYPDSIYFLRTTTPGVASAGVAVGDTRERVLAVFGPPAEDIIEAGRRSLAYTVEIEADRLVFELEGDRITAIDFYALVN